jgi:transcriptional regulator with XRE-family HTH domain
MSSATVIGQRIKTLREEKGIAREAFCNAVGITLSALSMYENGQRIPRDEIKVKIARVLETSIEALFFAS